MARFQVAVQEGEAAGLMVGGDHYQRLTVLVGKTEGCCNGPVKGQLFDDGSGEAVRVAGVVNLGSFHHEEKALAGEAPEFVDGLGGNVGQKVQCFLGGVRAHSLVDGNHLARDGCGPKGVVTIGIAFGFDAGHQVQAVLPGIFEIVRSAAAQKVQVAGGGEVTCDEFGAVTLRSVAVEYGRGGVGDVSHRDHACGLAFVVEPVGQAGIPFGTVMVGGDVARPGEFAGGEGAAARCGVADEIVLRVVELDADALEFEEGEIPVVGIGAGGNLVQAHAVADEKNHVLDSFLAAVVPEGGRIGGNALRELKLFVLET